MPIGKKKLDYKWVILVLCVMMNFVCLGFCSSNKGIYLAAITDALGAPVANLSYDISGSYKYALFINSAFMLLGCLVFCFVLKEVAQTKKQLQVKEN